MKKFLMLTAACVSLLACNGCSVELSQPIREEIQRLEADIKSLEKKEKEIGSLKTEIEELTAKIAEAQRTKKELLEKNRAVFQNADIMKKYDLEPLR